MERLDVSQEGFKQCTEIMVYDPACQVYTLISYAWVINGRRLPATIICDVKQALIDALGSKFRTLAILIASKENKQYISQDAIRIAMASGVFDMLTVVPPEQGDPQRNIYVVNKRECDCAAVKAIYAAEKRDEFFAYF
ncbi:hypothetical protein PHMEG_00014716 [Phytophthora megakarya]|uniref:Uncharacterized protein n=1 Tax=Phytophthora megakarya TaxID=4795 RepID=A0A225W396_9STRA|nr:hypothetical protein PHMEG_00014716 [Phytophthora megakarya]